MQGEPVAQVQLVDEDHDDGAAGGARPDGRGWRRRRWWVMGAAGLLAVGAAAFAVVDEQERQADLARYADVPGTVDSLAEPPQEAWRAELDGQAVQLADLLVSAPAGSPDPASPTSLTGRDLDTGAERWRVEGPGGAPGWCVAELAAAEGPVLLCVLPDPEEQDEFGSPVFAWRLVDAASGAVDPAPQAVAEALMTGNAGVADGDLLRVATDDAGARTLVRYDLATDAILWAAPLPRPEAESNGVLQVLAAGELIAVRRHAGTVLLDAQGEELHRLEREPTTGPAPERLPLLLRAEHGAGVWTGTDTAVWVAPDGTRTADLAGRPLDVEVVGDDERVVLLRRDGAVVGVDVRTGEELWERPLEGRARVQLDGRLVLSERNRLVAVDVRTGETRWETELPSDVDGATSPTLTDGLRLALSGVRDGRATLTAFDLASGGRLWDTRLPEGTRTIERYGRAVVAVTTAAGREPFVVLR